MFNLMKMLRRMYPKKGTLKKLEVENQRLKDDLYKYKRMVLLIEEKKNV